MYSICDVPSFANDGVNAIARILNNYANQMVEHDSTCLQNYAKVGGVR